MAKELDFSHFDEFIWDAKGSLAGIGDLFERRAENHSPSLDSIDGLPSPGTLQGIASANILDLIHDLREALPDQTQNWPTWLENPANLQVVKAIVVDHFQDLVHDVRETLPDALQDWSGWSELGSGLPDLGSIGDHLGDIGDALQSFDPSHLPQWEQAAHSTFEIIKDAAEDQFGDFASLSDLLSHLHAQDLV
jgi:hypothetical protein